MDRPFCFTWVTEYELRLICPFLVSATTKCSIISNALLSHDGALYSVHEATSLTFPSCPNSCSRIPSSYQMSVLLFELPKPKLKQLPPRVSDMGEWTVPWFWQPLLWYLIKRKKERSNQVNLKTPQLKCHLSDELHLHLNAGSSSQGQLNWLMEDMPSPGLSNFLNHPAAVRLKKSMKVLHIMEAYGIWRLSTLMLTKPRRCF